MILILDTACFTIGAVTPRDNGPPDLGDATVADPGLQTVPDTAKAPNAFGNGKAQIFQESLYSVNPILDLYRVRI